MSYLVISPGPDKHPGWVVAAVVRLAADKTKVTVDRRDDGWWRVWLEHDTIGAYRTRGLALAAADERVEEHHGGWWNP